MEGLALMTSRSEQQTGHMLTTTSDKRVAWRSFSTPQRACRTLHTLLVALLCCIVPGREMIFGECGNVCVVLEQRCLEYVGV